jgi:hypothetical protein
MGVYQIFALLAAVLPSRVFSPDGTVFVRADLKRGWAATAAVVALVALFVAYVIVFDRAVLEAHPASVLAGLPLRFVNAVTKEGVRASFADELLVLAFAEALALGVFLFHLGALEPRVRRATIGFVAVALAAAALATPATDSGDPYFYVGLATLGAHAYAPPGAPFTGDLRAINAIWGTPVYASSYGPVWIALSALLVAPLGTLAAKLFAFKVLGLAAVIACAYLARRLGASPIVVAGIACNPALYVAYVAGAHNDLLAVDLVLAALLACRESVSLAFAAALAASLVKPTLAPIAMVAFAGVPSLRVRVGVSALLALVVAAIYAFDGGLLFHALTRTVGAFAHPMTPADAVLRVTLVAVAIASCVWIVLTGRVRSGTAWAPPAFGGAALPSYAIWGLPLALETAPVALVYLVTLPFLLFFQSTALPATNALDLTGEAFVATIIIVAAYRLRPRH